ncbi:MAG: hypothetical protein HWD63_13440 [Candidatus Parvibacillus calidus]|nr:MAG: hypothetical protein HWD63_13440 [Candidatus Parvibacillus calidus]
MANLQKLGNYSFQPGRNDSAFDLQKYGKYSDWIPGGYNTVGTEKIEVCTCLIAEN